jgi:hypothetical protein
VSEGTEVFWFFSSEKTTLPLQRSDIAEFFMLGPLGIDVKGYLIAVHPVPEKISMVFR